MYERPVTKTHKQICSRCYTPVEQIKHLISATWNLFFPFWMACPVSEKILNALFIGQFLANLNVIKVWIPSNFPGWNYFYLSWHSDFWEKSSILVEDTHKYFKSTRSALIPPPTSPPLIQQLPVLFKDCDAQPSPLSSLLILQILVLFIDSEA